MNQLSESDSVNKVSSSTDRHIQLCSQNKDGEKYANAIRPFYQDLEEKEDAFKKAIKGSVAANDTIKLRALFVDEAIRDLHGRTEEYDRHHSGVYATRLIFPDGNISGLITKNENERGEIASDLALKVGSLGSTHELYPFKALFETLEQDCIKATKALEDAETLEKAAKINLQLAKVNLVRKYNANFFAAADDKGKVYAEKLFPQIKASPKKDQKKGTPGKAA